MIRNNYVLRDITAGYLARNSRSTGSNDPSNTTRTIDQIVKGSPKLAQRRAYIICDVPSGYRLGIKMSNLTFNISKEVYVRLGQPKEGALIRMAEVIDKISLESN